MSKLFRCEYQEKASKFIVNKITAVKSVINNLFAKLSWLNELGVRFGLILVITGIVFLIAFEGGFKVAGKHYATDIEGDEPIEAKT